ncbi:hypothetical protein [Bradyrhizobium japonicum]|uniref:hypothetical protein n=1 Tax=Bradyrhizobium japonicum TaxID=375 RepID=UPI001E4B499E|nr:hypothetical protein [Bradyrhizobium japonicum]MCD9821176.1 hypothetical protein [Bradyrhizobium japonicum]MEB2674127.1 hypothetical protein [Bradyrhizobium japonicum]WRI93314.1 hypothetical protein R3F75_21215 [Bradyrhizobium japonicum]
MKMTTSDFEPLKAALLDVVSGLNLKPTDIIAERDMWNVLHMARQKGTVNLMALYEDYNDAHILTAMRRVFGAKETT